jgi:predicted glycogen debranching enzyme
MLEEALFREWLETDGASGFAMGTTSGIRTRRYHGLLCAAPPGFGRLMLVSGLEVSVTNSHGKAFLSTEEYQPDVIHPDGYRRIESFRARPWPRWCFRLDDGSAVSQEILCVRETGETLVRFELLGGSSASKLEVRPLVAGRDYHALQRENAAFSFEPERVAGALVFRPYSALPRISVRSNGRYAHGPLFYRSFRYREEVKRGLDHVEDLGSPGALEFDLGKGPAYLAFGYLPDSSAASELSDRPPAAALIEREAARRAPLSSLEQSREAYTVEIGGRRTIIAGYPWFTDWGRDTFIALRGLSIATGKLDEAEAILRDWSGVLKDGLLPNFFPDGRAEPEYNSIDASLWFVIAVHDFLSAPRAPDRPLGAETAELLTATVEAILNGLLGCSRYGVRATPDGLLSAGAPGVQLTWMDAKVEDFVVTPRVGKPVEIQALWLNALRIASELGGKQAAEWSRRFEQGLASFRRRFWNEQARCLFDVVDADHEPGKVDSSVRPNQIYAVGGLPHGLLQSEPRRAVVERVERELWTPAGVRTLSPRDPRYRGRYGGGVFDRDTAYHMGTAWAFLLGPFVEAWLRVRGESAEARAEARERFLEPWLAGLDAAGLGHLSEIADGDFPHTPRGAPFQAWSLGELLRLLPSLGGGVGFEVRKTR